MSFSTFSKEFTSAAFTSVENPFITKYLPHADGDAVRAYLYGLYLCQCSGEFDAASAAKLLGLSLDRLKEIFSFWEECDLVHVLSRDPLYVEYLPVSSAVGKPKPIRPEKYAEFNRELYKQLQKAGRDLRPYEMQRVLEFLENNQMEPQAFLLVSEYCVKKDGEKLTANHILNKAAKLCREQKFTYEQVEKELADFNSHEREIGKIFTLLGVYRKPQEADYDLFAKWAGAGMETGAVYACAEAIKHGSLSTLDSLVGELRKREIFTEADAREYLARREERTSVVYKVAKRLGVKVQNPRPYSEDYAEKWLERGYDAESLTLLAGLALKLGYGFPELDALIDRLYAEGIVDEGGVRAYCAEQDGDLRLLQKIQSHCGVLRKTQSALDMIAAWKSWNFSEAMILEAAKRSANAAAALPYMNKLLSEWKRAGAYTPEEIPERSAPAENKYRSEAAIAADERSERERYYAALRDRAAAKAERANREAQKDEAYRAAESAVRKGEIELAKAEVFSPAARGKIEEKLAEARRARTEALARLRLTEEDLLPRYACAKCSDTGFLPDGRMCDCYPSGLHKRLKI